MSSLIALALLQAASPPAAAAGPPAYVQGCATAAHASFDFWVGEWEVYPNLDDPAKAPLVANSRIERLYGGCAIRENWMPLHGLGGGSLNNFDPATGLWHQTWIGSGPGRVEFTGGPAGPGKMVMTGFWKGVNGPGKDAWIRMTYTLREDGSVRQFGEASEDHGMTWVPNFDFIYRPKGKPAS